MDVSEGYCNQEVILLISDNGATPATEKAFVISPWLHKGFFYPALIYPNT